MNTQRLMKTVGNWGDWSVERDWRLAYGNRTPSPPPSSPVLLSEEQIDFRIWKDMVECPSKYGDDIVEWLDLNEKLEKSDLRWRIAAYWWNKEREIQTKKENTAATKIQALFRGHRTRHTQLWRDCALCLQHTICPVELRYGLWVCRECKEEGDSLC